MKRKSLFSLALGAAALAFSGAPAFAAPVQHLTVYVFRGEMSPKGPDGHGHDMIVPSNFVLHAGEKVVMKIINYDEGPHSITAAGMHLNINIKPGHEVGENVEPITTTASFTPTKAGNFRWHCNTMCDPGGHYFAMSKGYDGPDQDGYMAGYFMVLK